MPKYKVGIGVWKAQDVVYVVSDGYQPNSTYNKWNGYECPEREVDYETTDVTTIAKMYCQSVGMHKYGTPDAVLECNGDGWGLFERDAADEPWELTDYHDPIQQREIDMADQAYINDLRFGAPSDYDMDLYFGPGPDYCPDFEE